VSTDTELTPDQAAAALDLKAGAVFLAAPDGRVVARI
jgi:hypothetical protein